MEHGLWEWDEWEWDEGAVEIEGNYLTHVAHVKVCPPDGRAQNNPGCYIYGHISVNVGLSGDPVTLYRRHRDNPDLLDLSDEYVYSYLPLTDGHEGDRALGAVSESNPLYLNMKLYEKTEQEEDVLIADFENFEYYEPDFENFEYYEPNYYQEDNISYFNVTGEFGFRFEVCYTVVFGARAEIEISIKGEEGGVSVPVWGDIAAFQSSTGKSPDRNLREWTTTLLNIYEGEEVTYNYDEPIELQRRFVVAPMRVGRDLSICIGVGAVVTDNENPNVHEDTYVYFPLYNGKELGVCMVNKDMTHTKLINHVSGTVFSVAVAVKFFHPEKVSLIGV